MPRDGPAPRRLQQQDAHRDISVGINNNNPYYSRLFVATNNTQTIASTKVQNDGDDGEEDCFPAVAFVSIFFWFQQEQRQQQQQQHGQQQQQGQHK
jgi:hypothetical protein